MSGAIDYALTAVRPDDRDARRIVLIPDYEWNETEKH